MDIILQKCSSKFLNCVSIIYFIWQVNSNGVLSFVQGFTVCCPPRDFPRGPPPLIAPFWHDFNPRNGGTISYRMTDDFQLRQLVHVSIQNFVMDDFFPTILVVATWDHVAPFGGTGVCILLIMYELML